MVSGRIKESTRLATGGAAGYGDKWGVKGTKLKAAKTFKRADRLLLLASAFFTLCLTAPAAAGFATGSQ